MKRFYFPRFVIVIAILIMLAVACSKGSDSPLVPNDNSDSTDTLGGRISLGIPVQDGDEVIIPVEFSGAVDLYAMSFRVGFGPNGLEPVGIQWSNQVGEEDATFSHLNQHNYVPLAFARYSGMPGLDGHGTLAHLRFRILDPNYDGPWIIRDRQFLRARNSIGVELRLEVGGDSR